MIDHQRLQAVPFDDWNAVAESAVRDAVRRAMKGVLTEDQAVAAVAAVIDERRATVTTKAREAAEGARLLARFDQLVARGHGRNAAMMVAREFGEPHEWEIIADRVRRLRTKRRKRAA